MNLFNHYNFFHFEKWASFFFGNPAPLFVRSSIKQNSPTSHEYYITLLFRFVLSTRRGWALRLRATLSEMRLVIRRPNTVCFRKAM